MKKLLFSALLLVTFTGCASIAQTDNYTNEAQIERITLYDSTNIYIIQWKGRVFLYDLNHYPPITEIDVLK